MQNILYNETNLPKDIINTIINFTHCDCNKQKIKKPVIIKNLKCYYCDVINISSSPNIKKTICNYCKKFIYFKKCIICHTCLIDEKQPVIKCLECNDNIINYNFFM